MNGAFRGMLSAALLVPLGAQAQTSARQAEQPESDRYVFVVHGETHVELFRRGVTPWQEGAFVETETLLPLSEYVSLHATDLDTGLGKDSLDLDLAAYGQVVPGSTGGERRVDGDVQTASIRLHQHGVSLRLGRQLVASGRQLPRPDRDMATVRAGNVKNRKVKKTGRINIILAWAGSMVVGMIFCCTTIETPMRTGKT